MTPIKVLWSPRIPAVPIPHSGTGLSQGAGHAGGGSRSLVLSPKHVWCRQQRGNFVATHPRASELQWEMLVAKGHLLSFSQ